MPFVRVYPRDTQEMVVNAHDRAFTLCEGDRFYGSMKTAVETISSANNASTVANYSR